MKRKSFYRFTISLTFLFLVSSITYGVTLKLKNGNPLEGKLVSVEENKITFETNGMLLTLPKDRIVPPDTEWSKEAKDAFDSGDYSKALEYCKQLLIWDPENVKIKELLSQSRKKAEEKKLAKEQAAFQRKAEETQMAIAKANAEDAAKAKEEKEKKKPLEILKRVSETYSNLSTYYFDISFMTEIASPSMNQSMNVPVVLAAEKPDKMRLETKSELMDMLIISDGTNKWMSMPMMKEYFRVPADEKLPGKNHTLETATEGVDELLDLAKKVKETKILREEFVPYGNSSVECYVLSAEFQSTPGSDKLTGLGDEAGPVTFWIDKNQYSVMKVVIPMSMKGQMMGMKITLSFNTIKLNSPLSNNLFVFTPPPGSKEVSMDAIGKNLKLPQDNKK